MALHLSDVTELISLCSALAYITFSQGMRFFHSEGTLGYAARKGMLFRTSSLAESIRLGNVSLGKGFWRFWLKTGQILVIDA